MPSLVRIAGGCLVLVLIAVTGCIGEETRTPGQPVTAPVVAPAQGGTAKAAAPARFEATVYQVEASKDRLGDLDAQRLEARAATAQDLEKALAGLGPTKVLYKVDQQVNLRGDTINVGERTPFVTNSQMGADGQVTKTISYQQTGMILKIEADASAAASDGKGPPVRLRAELATLGKSGVEISHGVNAVVINNISNASGGPFRYGRPVVAIAWSNTSPGDTATPAAFVMRYVFSEVKP